MGESKNNALPSKPSPKVLDELNLTATHLHQFLESFPDLTDTQQLYVENRLTIMQMEFIQWAQHKNKKKTG